MSMSQRDFERLADEMAALSRWVEYLDLKPRERTLGRAIVDQAIKQVCQACKASNPRFNPDRFSRWVSSH